MSKCMIIRVLNLGQLYIGVEVVLKCARLDKAISFTGQDKSIFVGLKRFCIRSSRKHRAAKERRFPISNSLALIALRNKSKITAEGIKYTQKECRRALFLGASAFYMCQFAQEIVVRLSASNLFYRIRGSWLWNRPPGCRPPDFPRRCSRRWRRIPWSGRNSCRPRR